MKLILFLYAFYIHNIETKKNFETKDFEFIIKNQTKKKELIETLGKGLDDEFLNNENMFYKVVEKSFFKKTYYIIKVTFNEDEVVEEVTHLSINNYIDIKNEFNFKTKKDKQEVFKQIKKTILNDNDINDNDITKK